MSRTLIWNWLDGKDWHIMYSDRFLVRYAICANRKIQPHADHSDYYNHPSAMGRWSLTHLSVQFCWPLFFSDFEFVKTRRVMVYFGQLLLITWTLNSLCSQISKICWNKNNLYAWPAWARTKVLRWVYRYRACGCVCVYRFIFESAMEWPSMLMLMFFVFPILNMILNVFTPSKNHFIVRCSTHTIYV